MTIEAQITQELDNYFNGTFQTEGHSFSTWKLVKRIFIYANKIYPKGKLTKRKEYKYWFDIITPRIDSEVKNIDFDRKNISLVSDAPKDALPLLIANAQLKDYMKRTGQGERMNEAVEQGSGWGNHVWIKTKGGDEDWDPMNFFVINQAARTLDDSAVIRREELTASQLLEKSGTYKNVETVIKEFYHTESSTTATAPENQTTTRMYWIFQRDGEVSLAALQRAQGETASQEDEQKYVFARIIIACESKDGSGKQYVLFADTLSGKMHDYYKEYHRGRYQGRWWREGLYEILMDCQTRANEIGNQLARGLEWASKTVFSDPQRMIVQNIITDMNNGDVVKASEHFRQIETRMNGFDQLQADWNRNIELANDLSNSREIVQGITPASGTPLGTSQLLNQNANKLFDFIREKLGLAVESVYESWRLRDMLRDLKAQDIIKLMGDSDIMDRFYDLLANSWYVNNLPYLPPHGMDIQQALIADEKSKILARPDLFLELSKGLWDDFLPRVSVDITGEGVNLESDLASLGEFINLEMDPVRRTALIEMAMNKKGIDAGSLPKSPPQPLPQPAPQQTKQPIAA